MRKIEIILLFAFICQLFYCQVESFDSLIIKVYDSNVNKYKLINVLNSEIIASKDFIGAVKCFENNIYYVSQDYNQPGISCLNKKSLIKDQFKVLKEIRGFISDLSVSKEDVVMILSEYEYESYNETEISFLNDKCNLHLKQTKDIVLSIIDLSDTNIIYISRNETETYINVFNLKHSENITIKTVKTKEEIITVYDYSNNIVLYSLYNVLENKQRIYEYDILFKKNKLIEISVEGTIKSVKRIKKSSYLLLVDNVLYLSKDKNIKKLYKMQDYYDVINIVTFKIKK